METLRDARIAAMRALHRERRRSVSAVDCKTKFRFHKGENMTKTLADAPAPIERADLHAMLDSLLDSADPSTDALDPTTFWTFMHVLGLGRSIAEDLNKATASDIAKHGLPEDPEELRRAWHGLMLDHLLRRLDAHGQGTILPVSFDAAKMLAHAHNIAGRKPELPDIFSV
jgi:hypothetical protein